MFAPILCLCQSSGHGKTRTMLEIAEDEFVIFICLRKRGVGGYPSRSPISDEFERSLNNKKNALLFVHALLETFMKTVDSLKKERRDGKKLSALFKETQPWYYYSIDQEINRETLKQRTFRKAVLDLYENLKNGDVPFITRNHWEAFTKRNEVGNVFMFVDEAGQLIHKTDIQENISFRMGQIPEVQKAAKTETPEIIKGISFRMSESVNAEEPKSPKIQDLSINQSESSQVSEKTDHLTRFRVLRRVIQQLFQEKCILLVLADTTTSITEFEQNSNEFTASMKQSPLSKLFQPFTDLLFVNQCVPPEYLNSLSQMSYEELMQRDPTKNVFLYGRPMWAMALSESQNVARENWLHFVNGKLRCGNSTSLSQDKESAIFVAYSFLSVRTTLSLHFDMTYSARLVAKHLATLLHINNTRTRIQFKYIQEPVLAEGTAHIMADEHETKKMLEALKSMLNMNLNVTGGIGEVVAQLILLQAFDKARTKPKSAYNTMNFLSIYILIVLFV